MDDPKDVRMYDEISLRVNRWYSAERDRRWLANCTLADEPSPMQIFITTACLMKTRFLATN